MSLLAELSDAAKARLWERILHEDNLLNERFNVFIVFESALFGVVGVLYTTGASNLGLVHFISILGLIFTALWIAVLFKQKRLVDGLERLIVEARFEEYIISLEMKELNLSRLAKINETHLLAVIIPLMIAFLWVLAIFFI